MRVLMVGKNANIYEAEYNTNERLKEEEVIDILNDSLKLYSNDFEIRKVDEDIKNIYNVKFNGNDIHEDFTVCIREMTPGGRSQLKDEQRIQPKARQINYIYNMNSNGKLAILLGAYKRDGEIILSAWKANQSFAGDDTGVSKQIKIDTLAYAMNFGFAQQKFKNGTGFVCAFKKEFLFFYIKNNNWLHDKAIEYLNKKIGQTYDNKEFGYIKDTKKKLYNRIVFGAPGTGKSYKIKSDIKEAGLQKNQYKRVTFHPNYTYSKFVGSYKPVGEGEDIGYKFIGGPFLDILIESLKDEKHKIPHVLVIEEINRANPAAVFGDVFQLLDRDSNGKSIYNIDMSDEMKNYVNNRLEQYGMEEISELYIPSNMYIWATMNSADQGVYHMDSAFKRRWSFEYIGIDENEEKIKGNEYGIIELPTKELDSENNRIYKKYVWNDVRKAINNELKNSRINEDKLLGPFFLSEKELIESRENFDNIFKSKVLMYLYEDILKHKNIPFFKEDDKSKVNTLADIMRNYDLGKIFTFELNEYKEIKEVIEDKGDEIKEPIGV
ncbi:MAG: AAA family ATPase [Clostridium perfringens]|uniref:AAA family ATPase n=1 Tax=Clostridium perfringens TaxID=1502 RepID=UPI001CB10D78|nr:AAA family ATPase [Clostridium perfringens]MDU3377839.1 AAA family ATPase [Clostridium perfringens]MDU3534942.1 AAA family ATPase [Clostridium perfringens]HBI6975151.1 AAA family ATPase [Clostridium perfringens]